MDMKHTARIIINIVIAVSVPAAWIWMALSAEGTLASTGLRSLRYFTVLSNFLEGIASIAYIVSAFRHSGEATYRVRVFKYVAAVQVAITFLTVAVLLVPIWGILDLFSGPNLFFHLLVPLAAITEYIVFRDNRLRFVDNLFVMIPVFLYGVAYTINIIINGIGDTPETTNDWYYFLNWGWYVGAAIFVGILSTAFVVGFILRLTKRKNQ